MTEILATQLPEIRNMARERDRIYARSALAETLSGVFLKLEISLVSSATRRADTLRSFATLRAGQ